MSNTPEDEPRPASTEPDIKEPEGAETEPKAKEPERVDEDGLPLDREPTLDDVRSNAGSGRTIAVGCTGLIVVLVLAFWILRAYVLH